MTTTEFSKLIKKQHIKLNLTQKELAQNLNVSNKTISRWKTGSGYLDIETILILKKVLVAADFYFGENTYIVNNRINNKRYLILVGQNMDYNEMVTQNKNKTLEIALTGNKLELKVKGESKYFHEVEIDR